MARFVVAPPIPGAHDLFSLMAFLSDKTAVSNHLKQCEAAREEANEMVGKLAKIKDIESTQAQTARALAEATKELEDAKSESTKIRAQARKYADKKESDSDAKLGSIAAELDKLGAELAAKEKDVTAREASLLITERSVKGKVTAAERIMAEGRSLKKDYEEKLSALRSQIKGL